MKLYSYSSELLTFVEKKWTKIRIAAIGIIIGTTIFFGFITLNLSYGHPFWSRSSYALAAENDILQRHIGMVSPRVSHLEIQERHLREHSNELFILLHPGMNIGDSSSYFKGASKALMFQSLIPAPTNFHP